MEIPTPFQKKIINSFGVTGEKWLYSLETKTEEVAKIWGLKIEGPVTNLSYNYVVNVTDMNNKHYILKMGFPGFDFQNEVRTVQLYNGEGCANVLQADFENGAMLLEKLNPGTMLCEERDEIAVVEHFCRVWKKIRRPLPPEGKFPMITDWASALDRANEGPISNNHIQLAREYIEEISQSSSNIQLLHGDLHHENILFSAEHGWVAIDPKGVGGDPHFDLISFMINHLFTKPDPRKLLELRVELICKSLEMDRERLLKAAIGMSTLYACWAVEDKNPDWEETYQCAQWFKEFL
ncbi:hydroxyurea phosphotransferase [Sporosarcina luteola]|uniref:Hydroxyurea phosphotransferase n=1 Tax=Sporosarcina luteola TaxID=582850 RepID=A0A511Z931_9BACL|nr:aminoglycoside phosphotransferase family protein [Sporosarcina luteola]GEN83945.1 hydroxyurea phosphotransferase [Sporosarcina luteola]